jgi:plastocyanin
MRHLRFIVPVALLGVLLGACGGGGDPSSADTAPTDTSAPASSSTGLSLSAPVGAANTGFAETSLSAPADTPFSISFTNDDEGIPHNVQIFEGTDTTTTPVWAPADNALITGVDEVVYEVPALAAGTYAFNCFSHPATMVGTLTVS